MIDKMVHIRHDRLKVRDSFQVLRRVFAQRSREREEGRQKRAREAEQIRLRVEFHRGVIGEEGFDAGVFKRRVWRVEVVLGNSMTVERSLFKLSDRITQTMP